MSDAIPPSILQSMDVAIRLKSRMLEEKTFSAREECPRCGNRLHAYLTGEKLHLRLTCETPDCISVIE